MSSAFQSAHECCSRCPAPARWCCLRPEGCLGLLLGLLALLLGGVCAGAESVADHAVQVSAVVQSNPARITLSWPADPRATNYTCYRKTRTATSWGAPIPLAANATSYVDSSVAIGGAYEYRISRTAWNGSTNYIGEGYIYTGIQAPLVESRGKVILVVDNTQVASLARELTRLQQDLVGDGWTVLRHDVARTDSVASIKSVIKADYDAAPSTVKAVLLLGHIPVPYSGELALDGHPDHRGAWPADVYYGEMNGTWTDSTVDTSTYSPPVSDPRNRNVPGDGKFDDVVLPSAVELQVGRVDFANLPAFPKSETELLRQYLNKNHSWRHRFITAEPRGLIDDNLGLFGGEAIAVNGWRSFAPFFGASNTFASDWLTTLTTQSYLWGFGCGGGTYSSAGGVATTSQLVTNDPRVVFTMFFGSYFGDWDSQNNFLRAQLATATYTLASAWAGRPIWAFHHMGLGETIGSSARITQNNTGLYAYNVVPTGVHVALMGDPTLRMHPVAPPSALIIRTNAAGGLKLSWNPSTDPVAGYHVYRSSLASGPFSRRTASLLTTNEYVDATGSSQIYMVRAVKLEVSGRGSYYNPSQGIFQDLAGTYGPPLLTITRPTDGILLSWRANPMDYQLESITAPGSQTWFPVTNAVTMSNSGASVLLDSTGDRAFFRLQSR